MVERELISHRVTARTELANTLPPVLGDRVQLQQVIINLIMNGIDAMVSVADRPRELVIRSEQHKSDQVIVAVQDSGIGVSPMDMDRLFDAFFTTKPDGLGMGLRICRSIIEAHGGRLWASRNAATGATFQFSLRSRLAARSYLSHRPHAHLNPPSSTRPFLRGRSNDGPVTTYKAGQSFSELPGDRHGVSANASKTKPAKLLAVFVVDTHETVLTIPFGN